MEYERRDRTYRLAFGDCLHLQIPPSGNCRWNYRYRLGRKGSSISIGIYPQVNERVARERLNFFRGVLDRGLDPAKYKKKYMDSSYTIRTHKEAVMDTGESTEERNKKEFLKEIQKLIKKYNTDVTLEAGWFEIDLSTLIDNMLNEPPAKRLKLCPG